MDTVPDNRSLGELLSELSRETATLLRQELALAKSEFLRNVARLGRHAALIVGGGALAYAGLLTLIVAVVLVLVRWGLAPWGAALIVGAGILALGYGLLQYGLAALQRDQLTPEATIQTMKENAQWAKDQLR